MVFDEQMSGEVARYGVGMMAGHGRYHLIAALGGNRKVRSLCVSCFRDVEGLPAKQIRWFDSEAKALRAFCKQKAACQKCLRVIEAAVLDGDVFGY